jgi:hypothetical protein
LGEREAAFNGFDREAIFLKSFEDFLEVCIVLFEVTSEDDNVVDIDEATCGDQAA